MTPLAQKMAREMCKPLAQRAIDDRSGLASKIDEFQFFECSDILELAKEIIATEGALASLESGAFLPAPMTWIEVSSGVTEVGRSAFLVIQDGDEAAVYHAIDANDRARRVDEDWPLTISPRQMILPLRGGCGFGSFKDYRTDEHPVQGQTAMLIYALLLLLNSPGRIQRKAHLPHAGLQREMARAKGMVGKFPLRAWTEMKLSVTRKADEGGGPRDTHLTGERALHFVRQHLRVIGGQLVYIAGHEFRVGGVEIQIPAHWRGNPANGIHRKRYAVTL